MGQVHVGIDLKAKEVVNSIRFLLASLSYTTSKRAVSSVPRHGAQAFGMGYQKAPIVTILRRNR
jgi:hypothetical protein